MTLRQPGRERVRWEPEVLITVQPIRKIAARTLLALVALNLSGSGRHHEGDVRGFLGRYLAFLQPFGDGVQRQGLHLGERLFACSAVDVTSSDRLNDGDPPAVFLAVETDGQRHD